MDGPSTKRKHIAMSARSKSAKNMSPDKDLALGLASFFMKIVGLWLFKDNKELRNRNLTLIYTLVAILFGVWVQVRDFYYSWPNFADCSYTACNLVMLVMVLLKLTVLLVHRGEFMDLLLYTYKHYWHTNYDDKELVLLKSCRRLCFICLALINFCAQATLFSYVITPIIANVGRNSSDRIPLFNMWLDLPLSVSPWYELIFVIQVLSLYHVGVCYTCFDNILCLLNLHAATQFRMLQYRLSSLGDTDQTQLIERVTGVPLARYAKNCYKSFKCCVQQHQDQIIYCRKLNDIFTITVLGHIIAFSIVMCLVGFQVFMADSPPTRRLIFVFHIMGSLSQLLLFTYSSDGLIHESMNIGSAIYCGPWIHLPMTGFGRKLRRDLTMVILRSKNPCCLTACGFFPVSLETCTKVLSTAMSYFTLMRQSVDN